MERKDVFIVLSVAAIVSALTLILGLDYVRIADHGLTLCSIVLAVYVGAIIGLVNSNLAQKMAQKTSKHNTDYTQLGILTKYFKFAVAVAIITIVVSSASLLVQIPTKPTAVDSTIETMISVMGFIFFAENLTFLCIIIRFMLNRQIWDA